MPRPTPKAPPPQPIQYFQLKPDDLKDEAGVGKLNMMLTQIINAQNAGSGATGRTILPAGIDVQGETISGLGSPKSPTDAISAGHADSNYGAPAIAPQLDIGGKNALKGLTGLWLKVNQIAAAGVQSLNSLTGNLHLLAGSNVTISSSGEDITIAANASSGIDTLTGDVEASGSGTVEATVVGVNGASVPVSQAYVGTNSSGQVVPAAAPSSGITQLTGDVTAGPGSGSVEATLKVATVGWTVLDGSPATDLGNIQSMLRATNLSECALTVTASDAATDLTFDIEQNGTSVFAAPPTVAHGAARGQQFSFALRAASLPVAKGDNFSLNITAGTSDWKFSLSLE